MIMALGEGAGIVVRIFSTIGLDTFCSCVPNGILKNDIFCHGIFFYKKFMGIKDVNNTLYVAIRT